MMLLQTNNDAQAALDVLSNPMTNSTLQQHLAGRSARHRPSEAAVVRSQFPVQSTALLLKIHATGFFA